MTSKNGTRYDEQIRTLVEAAPPLTDKQRANLAALLRPASTKENGGPKAAAQPAAPRSARPDAPHQETPEVAMPNPSGVRVELVTVTPKLARQWLGRNFEKQRKLRANKVDQYARDIAAGHWPITGDTIKLTADNVLIDGQHRLSAVIQADQNVPMLVAFGVDEAVMPVLDIGLGRNFADVLNVRGVPNRSLLGAIVRRIVQWERGNYLGVHGPNVESPTHAEMLDRYEKEPAAFDTATARADDVRKAGLGIASAAGAAFYLFTAIDAERAHQFFDHYLSGANLPASHPILSLRNRIVRITSDERMRSREQLALFIRAWNAWRDDRPLDRVMITSAGRKLNNKNFPQPK